MNRTILSLLAVLTILAAPALGTANDTSRSATVDSAKERFYVYGGRCSRSIQLQGTFENFKDACAAAETYRTREQLRFVTVRTGAHDKDYFGTSATQYRLYRLETKCGNWIVQETTDSAEKAKELADKLKKDLMDKVKNEPPRIEIVGYYAAK